jgi:hypothetical protein
MSKTPFENQRFPVDLVDQIADDLARGRGASGNDLVRALDQLDGPKLSDCVREIVRQFSAPAVKARGRPANPRGRIDFALEELDAAYPALLASFQKASRASDGRARNKPSASPSELAYRQLARDMSENFVNIDWLALRNQHSKWKRGHLHPAEHDVDSNDFDAEFERHFPPPRRS